MPDTFGEREFVRRLSASPRKGAAIAAAFLIVAIGAMTLLPQTQETSTAKKTPLHTKTEATTPHARQEEASRQAPDPAIGIGLIVPGNMPESLVTVGMQTVAIRVTSLKSGSAMFGTGFIARDGIVVTAAHLFWHFNAVSDDTVVEAYCDGRRFTAEILARDDRRDVAILSVPACTGAKLRMGAYRSTRGPEDLLYATGYTFDASLKFAERFTHTAHPLDDEGRCAVIDVGLRKLASPSTTAGPPLRYGVFTGALIHGNSGSPVIDGKGRVVGMFVIFNNEKDYSCYVPGEEIARILDSIR